MNTQVFNTEFEVSLRILCILANTNEEMSFEQLLYFDFISTYAREFELAKYNIQGDSNYKLSEFVTRRIIIAKALQQLVLDRYVLPITKTSGFRYKITKKGLSFNMKMNDEYFYHLKTLILKIFEIYGNKSEQEIHKEINEKIGR